MDVVSNVFCPMEVSLSLQMIDFFRSAYARSMPGYMPDYMPNYISVLFWSLMLIKRLVHTGLLLSLTLVYSMQAGLMLCPCTLV